MESMRRSLLSLSCRAGCLKTLNTPEATTFGLINVRFRKRRDIRRAPSKLYYVREPTPKEPVEFEMIVNKYRIYKTEVGSINAFLKSLPTPISEMRKEKKIEDSTRLRQNLDIAVEINDLWNADIADQRELRLAEEAVLQQREDDLILSKNLQELEQQQILAKELLSQRSQRMANALDVENLDEALDEFLDREPVSHNFAITGKGQVVRSLDIDQKLKVYTVHK